MAFRLACLLALCVALAAAEPKKKVLFEVDDDGDLDLHRDYDQASLFVKDTDNGELRFLTGSAGNAVINQYITQQQDMLEQLRPSTGSTGTAGTAGTTGILGTGTSASTGVVSSGSYGGVTPIVVNLGGSSSSSSGSTSGTNAILQSVITGASPIGNVLPQVVASSVLSGTRRVGNRRRRVGNKRRRRGNRRRRPGKKGKKGKKPQVYILRPSG